MKLQIPPLVVTTPVAPASAIDTAQLIPITAAWQLDLAGQRLVGQQGEILLPALEFRLLAVFHRHPHRVLSREQLLDLAWGPAFDGTDRAVDRAVYRLRHLLEPDPDRPAPLPPHPARRRLQLLSAPVRALTRPLRYRRPAVTERTQ